LLECEIKYYKRLILGLIVVNILMQLLVVIIPIKEYIIQILIASFIVLIFSIIISIFKIIIYFIKGVDNEDINCSDRSLFKKVASWLSSMV